MIPLHDQIQAAIESPQDADLMPLLRAFDAAIEGLDDQSLLAVAGETLSKIAAVFAAKYDVVFEEIAASGSKDGPVMSIDAFDCYVRSSMLIDFDQYIEPIPMLNLPALSEDFYSVGNDLVIYQDVETSRVSKVVTLATIEDWTQLLQNLTDTTEADQLNDIKDLAHDEEIEVWTQALRTLIEQLRNRKQANLPFLDLVDAVMQSREEQTLKECSSEIWLAFLLGNHPYQLRRTDHDFYSAIGLEVVVNEDEMRTDSSPSDD